MNHRIRLSLLCLVVIATMSLAGAVAPDGHWEGTIEIPGQPLAVDVDLSMEGEALTGDITIPAQNARDLPLTDLSLDGSSIRFTIGQVPGSPTFSGEISEDGSTIEGEFTQGAAAFPFTLQRAASAVEAGAAALEGFDQVINSALDAFDVPGAAIAIVQDGEVIFAEGYGLRNVAGDLPVTPDTLFPIGSSTKAFTTFTLGTLVDEGKLDWKTPVRHYLSDFELHDPVATLELNAVDLVTHRSGLPRHDLVWYNDQTLTRRELVDTLRWLEPSEPIRTTFQYNNLMYLTAGFLIEELTGKSWEDAVRARVLDPLGMTRTVFSDAIAETDPDHARPYRYDDEEILEIPFREVGNMGPAGSISSSVNEMSRWMLVNLRGGEYDGRKLIGAATLGELHTPRIALGTMPEGPESTPGSYALGWFVDSYRGHLRVHHGGNIDGFSALVTLFPNDDTGVVVLTNGNGNPLPGLLTRHAVDRLFNLERNDWISEAVTEREMGMKAGKEAEAKKDTVRVKGTKAAHPLDAYAGDYEHPGYGPLQVRKSGNRLEVEYNGIETPLQHWHYEVFDGLKADDPVFENMKFRFETDVNGNVATLEVPLEPFVDPISFRRQPDRKFSDPSYLQTLTGTYFLPPQRLTVSLQGDTLVLGGPGMPNYELEPDLGGWFSLGGVSGYRVRFAKADDGTPTMEISQPNGVYTARREK